MPTVSNQWELTCDGDPFTATLKDPSGNPVPLLRDILIHINADKEEVEMLITTISGTEFMVSSPFLDLKFSNGAVMKVRNIPVGLLRE